MRSLRRSRLESVLAAPQPGVEIGRPGLELAVFRECQLLVGAGELDGGTELRVLSPERDRRPRPCKRRCELRLEVRALGAAHRGGELGLAGEVRGEAREMPSDGQSRS